MARRNQKCPPTAVLLRLRWTKHKLPPTEVFSRLARMTTFAFCDRHDWSVHRAKFFRTKASEVLMTTDRFFCLARLKTFATGAAEVQVSANRSFVLTGSKEAHVTADWIILATGANLAKITTDRNFCDWRNQSKIVRGPLFSATEVTEGRAIADQSLFASGATESFSTGVTEA